MTAFCEDCGVTRSDVDEVISKRRGRKFTHLEWSVFESVFAASDFRKFYGCIPASALSKDLRDTLNWNDDNRIMMRTIRSFITQSQLEFEEEKRRWQKEDMDFREAIIASLAEKERLEAENRYEEELLEKALRLSLQQEAHKMSFEEDSLFTHSDEPFFVETTSAKTKNEKHPQVPASVKNTLVPVREARKSNLDDITDLLQRVKPKQANESTVSNDDPQEQPEKAFLKGNEPKFSEEEVRRRQEYLEKLRDQLVKAKQESRQRKFSELEQKDRSNRPRTMRAARNILGNEEPNIGESDDLAERRAIMAKLKSEISGLADAVKK
ncbi:unnamed protein product [Soboliphyme baturini]|uniref:Coiled-coil domain-containing protein 104 n=1 Tax=Soboliphyme baturini TaxID=241478 RepID=A0A183IQV3_9BILA|nr:unnamed protein product [Soboliphyme baturini]